MLEKDGNIHQTTDYDLFTNHERNRDCDPSNLRKLEDSIKTKNLLSYRPILIDANGVVIDGKHRLYVAKKLNLPIFYVCEKKASLEDIARLNQVQKPWGQKDWTNFYAKGGNVEYMKIISFCSEHKFKLEIGISLLGAGTTTENLKTFKNGKYIFPNKEEILFLKGIISRTLEISELISKRTLGNKAYLASPTFMRAMYSFLRREELDFETFMKKIDQKTDLFRSCGRVMDYLEIFKSCYNYRNQSAIN